MAMAKQRTKLLFIDQWRSALFTVVLNVAGNPADFPEQVTVFLDRPHVALAKGLVVIGFDFANPVGGRGVERFRDPLFELVPIGYEAFALFDLVTHFRHYLGAHFDHHGLDGIKACLEFLEIVTVHADGPLFDIGWVTDTANVFVPAIGGNVAATALGEVVPRTAVYDFPATATFAAIDEDTFGHCQVHCFSGHTVTLRWSPSG